MALNSIIKNPFCYSVSATDSRWVFCFFFIEKKVLACVKEPKQKQIIKKKLYFGDTGKKKVADNASSAVQIEAKRSSTNRYNRLDRDLGFFLPLFRFGL